MSKFKVGDTVRVLENYPYNLKIGEEFEVETIYNGRIRLKNFINNLVGTNSTLWPENSFELVQKQGSKVKQFDIKKDKWFVRTPNKEISDLVIQWLDDSGLNLHSFFDPDEHLISYGENACLGADGVQLNYGVQFSSYDYYKKHPERQEILLTYKTVIDTITFPVLEREESPAQKQLKVLKEQIAELSKQAEVLEGSL